MFYIALATLLLIALLVLFYFSSQEKTKHELTAPKLNNNPNRDVIVTELTPLISFFNSSGGRNRKYEIELDASPEFNSPKKISYQNIAENGKLITEHKIAKEDALIDETLYYWRVRAISEDLVKSDWTISRFFVDTKSDDHFINLVRAKIEKIEVSGGYNSKNIIDYDDPGLVTFWQSPPPGAHQQWVKFDLGKKTEICRMWILSNQNDSDGWLKHFYLESSNDSKNWQKITDSEIKDNNTFRNIINFKNTSARYFRLMIKDFIGYAAQINEVILYCPGQPDIPKIPNQDYVLIIGNEHNGFTFTDLAGCIEKLGFKTVTVPYYEASLAMVESLEKKPIAIVLSGNNADYPNLPMFEHNGEFEIIRNSHIPILGICAGHQFLAMAYGYTRARSMGWSDISAMEPQRKMTKIEIKKDDPIFAGISNNFIAPEIHGWAVVEPAEEFEVIASSSYVQAQKSTKRLIYGIQFHSEIDVSYNYGKEIIKNFLKMATEKNK